MLKKAIALYLGESYATIGLFNEHKAVLFEKSYFLPQVNLKNILSQTKQKLSEQDTEFASGLCDVFVVTKYFDRLKQFRLGGSISQVVIKGFENSYCLYNSKNLSLAANQLIISIDSKSVDEIFLNSELERVKKINPDLSKAVLALPEDLIASEKRNLIFSFFEKAGLKIFSCSNPYSQNDLRKTLLNAGSEGTKEEIIKELRECFGEATQVSFYCHDGFQQKFENSEVFNSANNFLAQSLGKTNYEFGAFFDLDGIKCVSSHQKEVWNSPWGDIPIKHHSPHEVYPKPFHELSLGYLNNLQIDTCLSLLEPGPVVAGRSVKPLMLDLFQAELETNAFAMQVFQNLAQENTKTKIKNLLSVLEKGQNQNSFNMSILKFKSEIVENILEELEFLTQGHDTLYYGPLLEVFKAKKKQTTTAKNSAQENQFSWTAKIAEMAELQ